MKTLRFTSATRSSFGAAARACASLALAAALASCGDDVDVCTNPGGHGCPHEFAIDFTVYGSGRFGALQMDISYTGDDGVFIGRGDKVECVPLVEAIVATNFLGEDTTKVGMISLEGVRMPGPILRCGFRTTDELEPNDFVIEVTDASDTNSLPIEPPPTVGVSSVTPR